MTDSYLTASKSKTLFDKIKQAITEFKVFWNGFAGWFLRELGKQSYDLYEMDFSRVKQMIGPRQALCFLL